MAEKTLALSVFLTHGGLQRGDVWLREAGGGGALGGMDGRVGGDGRGAAAAVRVFDVPAAVAAGAAALLQPAQGDKGETLS